MEPPAACEIFGKTVHYDTHPFLYEYILHFWILVFGPSEFSVRFLSAMASAALVPAWYWATRPVLSSWAALLFPAMCVTTLFWFDQSQQARAYALVQLDLALLFGFVTRASCASSARDAWKAAIWIIAISLPTAFLHFYAFMIVGVLILAALVLAKNFPRPGCCCSSAAESFLP